MLFSKQSTYTGVSSVDHNLVSSIITISCSKVSSMLTLFTFPSLPITFSLVIGQPKFQEFKCMRMLGLINELERNRKRFRRKCCQICCIQKRIIKLYTTVGIQELRVTADTNNNAFVQRWVCMALFWLQ